MKLHKDKQAMELLITNISGRTGVRRDVLEKDYYVTLLLKELTTKKDQNFSYFKGGTALYKALKSVRRFSEDIDLTVYVSDLDSQSQKQKRLKQSVLGYESLEFKEKIKDIRNSLEVSYKYEPLFKVVQRDSLQRFGNVKIEATSFTVSEPVMMLEIAPHLYELANDEEKNALEENFDVEPFKIGTISLERIFIDKVFASEYYYEREMYIDFCKHIYDIIVMYKLPEIKELFNDKQYINYLIGLKRTEELVRGGGVSADKKICNFGYLNDINLCKKDDFIESLNYIHDTYVFDDKDKIKIDDIQNTLLTFKMLFQMVENLKERKDDFDNTKKEKKKESDMEM